MGKTERFEMVFTENQMGRIQMDGDDFISVDMHGLSKHQAEKFLNNIINILREPTCINVIHGYNHGTAILEMVRNDFDNKKVQTKTSCSYNHGVTLLQVA